MKANLSRLIILAARIRFICLFFIGLASTIHVYLTLAEAKRFVAGE